jgi:hypothetical protein
LQLHQTTTQLRVFFRRTAGLISGLGLSVFANRIDPLTQIQNCTPRFIVIKQACVSRAQDAAQHQDGCNSQTHIRHRGARSAA